MKPGLLFPSGEKESEELFQTADLTRDLRLIPVFKTMSQGDPVIYQSVSSALLSPLTDAAKIQYRQAIMNDVLDNPSAASELYLLTKEALQEQNAYSLQFGPTQSVSEQFQRGKTRMRLLLNALRALAAAAGKNAPLFHSQGFMRLFASWQVHWGEPFINGVEDLSRRLDFPNGMRIQARAALNGYADAYRLLACDSVGDDEIKRAFSVSPRDEHGQADLTRRKELALGKTSSELARAVCNAAAYLQSLYEELAFYMGGLHLRRSLDGRGVPSCFPSVISHGWLGESLFELNTALSSEAPVGNSFHICQGCVITGADLGGKTTFLRSAAQAQLLLQAGLFVPGRQFSAQTVSGLFTHFQREEDPRLISGKLSEELDRVNAIVDHIRPGSLLLSDESFCSTNETEGSELAWQIFEALRERGGSIFAVTHLYPYAKRLWDDKRARNTFLCAERLQNGIRTYRMLPGEPEETAFCEDLYKAVFPGDDME